MKFKTGDLVRLKLKIEHYSGNYYVPDYTTNIPHIIHGSTIAHSSHNEKGGVVMGIDGNRVEVKYLDNSNNYVCLGFKEEDVEFLKIQSWRDKLCSK